VDGVLRRFTNVVSSSSISVCKSTRMALISALNILSGDTAPLSEHQPCGCKQVCFFLHQRLLKPASSSFAITSWFPTSI
jgi:hypothetical protein